MSAGDSTELQEQLPSCSFRTIFASPAAPAKCPLRYFATLPCLARPRAPRAARRARRGTAADRVVWRGRDDSGRQPGRAVSDGQLRRACSVPEK
eukprot:6178306-Pleurochrysis_carterae.AAC.3